MKKSIVSIMVVVFVASLALTALAAPTNPFSDLPKNHWAYDAVAKLQKAGIVEGYGDGTYRGGRAATRYEMAMVAARAMARSDKADAENKALIDKLAVEFAAELQTLGVRVTKLENDMPNLKFTGVADFRYTTKDLKDPSVGSSASGQWRARLDGAAKIDDATLGIRLTSTQTRSTGQYPIAVSTFQTLGSNEATPNTNTGNTLTIDRFNITKNLGAIKTTIGAQQFKLGSTGMIMDSGAYSFDGIKLQNKAGEVNLAFQYGRFQNSSTEKVDIASLEASSTAGKLGYGLGYATFKDNVESNPHWMKKYLYGNINYAFDSKFSVGGEYVTNSVKTTLSGATPNSGEGGKNAWTAYFLIGDQVLANAGDNNIKIQYMSYGGNSITRWSAFDWVTATYPNEILSADGGSFHAANAWNVTYSYNFSKNLLGYLQWVTVKDKVGVGHSRTPVTSDEGQNWIRAGVTAKF